MASNIFAGKGACTGALTKSMQSKTILPLRDTGDYTLEIRDATADLAGDDFQYRVQVRPQVPHVGQVRIDVDALNLAQGQAKDDSRRVRPRRRLSRRRDGGRRVAAARSLGRSRRRLSSRTKIRRPPSASASATLPRTERLVLALTADADGARLHRTAERAPGGAPAGGRQTRRSPLRRKTIPMMVLAETMRLPFALLLLASAAWPAAESRLLARRAGPGDAPGRARHASSSWPSRNTRTARSATSPRKRNGVCPIRPWRSSFRPRASRPSADGSLDADRDPFRARRPHPPSKIEDAAVAQPVSFRREIAGILTKRGCNSAICHGGVKGQGGFKLSANALYPADDYEWITKGGGYQVLTAEVKGERIPRIDLANPAKSLLLLKPTMAVAARRRQALRNGFRRLPDDPGLDSQRCPV